RSREGTTLAGVDRTLFTELTPETLKIAQETTEAIGQLSEDEWYVLAVHFEVAKQNN
ncbi:transcriptional antiterminator, partial [Enterococcus faecium]